MKRPLARILPLLAVLWLTLTGCYRQTAPIVGGRQAVDPSICDADDGSIDLPDGFCAVVVADDLGRLRHVAVRDNGDIYVIHRNLTTEGGISALRDTDGDGKADLIRTFGRIAGTGLDLYDGYLYASTDTSVYRFALANDELVPASDPVLIVGGFPSQGSHASKSFAFDDDGYMYVNVGGPSNACQQQARSPGSPGMDPCPQRDRQAGIWRFRTRTPGQTQLDDGHKFATGIRNSVAIAWNPDTERMYVAQHGRDQLHQLWGEHYTLEEGVELPAEELLQLEDGADFGWPYCYYDHRQDTKVLAPEYGGDGDDVGRCADVPRPVAAFPGHYAPNDLLFYTASQFPARYRNGAFIAFHGSWNRAPLPQQGYQIAFVPMSNGRATGRWETFADGFKGVETLENPGDAVYRPTGLALGADGTMYITDSVKGRIWRIIYRGGV